MELIQRWVRWSGLVLLILLVFELVTMRPATRQLWSDMVSRLGEGAFGVGYWDGTSNALDFAALEPGDIVLGGNTGSSWGHWTHAALYIGDGLVMDSFLQTGVSPRPVSAYNEYYSRAGALRVNLPREEKERAVALAKSLQGKPFYLLASRESDSLFYCSKVVWYVYHQINPAYNLDPNGAYWVIPDKIVRSPLVEPIGFSR
jgi:uncharacterized protein YycO